MQERLIEVVSLRELELEMCSQPRAKLADEHGEVVLEFADDSAALEFRAAISAVLPRGKGGSK